MFNLTKYSLVFDTICECNCDMVEDPNGEYVKFDDIKELLNSSHNMPNVQCYHWDAGRGGGPQVQMGLFCPQGFIRRL